MTTCHFICVLHAHFYYPGILQTAHWYLGISNCPGIQPKRQHATEIWSSWKPCAYLLLLVRLQQDLKRTGQFLHQYWRTTVNLEHERM